MVQIEVIPTDELDDSSYVVHDGSAALVVDPQRDIDRVQALLAGKRLRLDLVLETHRHNDYVTGGAALAAAVGARYAVPVGEDIDVGDAKVGDGDGLTVGGLAVTPLATPGHTHGHLSYVVRGKDGSAAPAVFTALAGGRPRGRSRLLTSARSLQFEQVQLVRGPGHRYRSRTAGASRTWRRRLASQAHHEETA
ncbi:MBL fold metallo-hydrolase [uncultured Modestobacter sp.]|uniref:MBL fold metallo-hydrolase n=1 Tax=uncultured Modestobacter sp. TaxID=380048 RepID=UPI002611E4B0|nr:MBL fold metallo-hydrolase [uncultured Modestobacter sp.]